MEETQIVEVPYWLTSTGERGRYYRRVVIGPQLEATVGTAVEEAAVRDVPAA